MESWCIVWWATTRMMNICIVASGDFFSTYGGGQVYVMNLVNELIRRQDSSYTLTIVSCHSGFTKEAVGKSYKGVDLYEIHPDGDMEALLRSVRPDVVHAHGEKAKVALCCSKLGVPCVVTAHHGGILCPAGTLLDYQDRICDKPACHRNCLRCYLKTIRTGECWYPMMRLLPQNRYVIIGKRLENKPFIPFVTPIGQAALSIEGRLKSWNTIKDHATKIIAPSQAIANSMILNGAEAGKVVVEPHGIPLPSVGQAPVEDSGKVRFYYVGRITYVKGIHVLLSAFAKIKAINAELHIIGGAVTKSEKRYQRRLMRQYGGDARIQWHGKVAPEQVSDRVASYDCMVHPTICLDVFGLNIAEALAQNKYVIATRCGGAEMQIQEGENGTLVEPNDADQLRRAMELYLLNPKRNRDNKVRSIGEHAASLLQIYQSLT